MTRRSDRPGGWGSRLPIVCGSFAIAVTLMVLTGWTFDIDRLKRIMPGFVSMNPTTAVSLLLAGAALALARAKPLVARALGVAVATIGGIKVAQLLFGLPIAIDEWLFRSQIGTTGVNGTPSRMAPNTATAVLFVGVALALLTARRDSLRLLAQGAAGVAAAIAMFALIGYLLGMTHLYGVRTFIPMALHTATTIMVLTIGALAVHTDLGVTRLVRDDGPAGALARMVLPLAVLVPVAVGIARLAGQQAGWYGTEVGIALQVLANVVVIFALLLGAIFALQRTDQARREREAALARSEARYRFAESAAHVGHWRLDAKTLEMSWSDEMFAIVGLDPALGVPSTETMERLFHDEDRGDALERFRRALTTGEGWAGTNRLMRLDGGMRFVKSQALAERDADGGIAALFGVMVDVTELETARQLAEQASREKAAFLANMSHEVRTPLNSIIGFTDLLLEDATLDARQRSQLGLIQNAGCALLTVVDDVLDYSKIGAGRIEFDVQPFAIATLVDNSVSIVRGTAEAKGLTIGVDIQPEVAPYYAGDEARLRQVLLNLLNNAVKFTAEGRVDLTVAARPAGDGRHRLYVAVADTGIGIAPDKQEGLFRQFSQADASVSREYGGTGLGLAICKSLIELMGGAIGLSSSVGEGSTFWFELELPVAEAPAASPAALAATATGARLLLVEDLPMNQELACAILTRAGHSIDVANNGLEAIEAVKSKPYDLVLMDIQMPKMDGLTATKLIRAMAPPLGQIPIIAMTANVLPEQVREFRATGMNDHVAKPIKQADLHRAIAAALAGDTPAAAGEATEPVAAPDFDPEVYAKVAMLFPPERLQTHLASFDRQVASAFANPTDREAVRFAAHKLVSQAGMLGFMKLSELCRVVEETCEAGTPIEAPIADARAAAATVHAKLTELMTPATAG